jgi:hypothetical protein
MFLSKSSIDSLDTLKRINTALLSVTSGFVFVVITCILVSLPGLCLLSLLVSYCHFRVCVCYHYLNLYIVRL